MVDTLNQNFTPAQDEYGYWMSQWERAKKKNKIKDAIVGFRMVADSRYRNSSLARKHQGIDYTEGVGSGGSKRQKLLNAARKEQWNQSQREAFRSQDFTSMEEFYSWAKDQPPWYDADMASKDATTVKNSLDAMKNTKVAEAEDILFAEYKDEWATGSYEEQTQALLDITNSEVIKKLPSKWRQFTIDRIVKSLNSFRSPTGQFTESSEARSVAEEGRKVEDLEMKVAIRDSANAFIKEYGPAWLTGLRPEQDTVMAELIEEFGDHEHFSLIHKDIMDKLKGMIPLTGKYASAIEARNVVDQRLQEIAATEATEKHTAAISKTATDKSKNLIASNISSDAAACVLAGDGSPGAREACFQEATAKWAETFPNVVSLISEDSRKRFNAAVEKKAAPPGTKKAYDASTGETIFATDAEIAANDNLVPEESNLEKDYAQVGREMVANGDMLPEVWETYRMGGMDKLDKSITGPDKDVILLWIDEVKKRRARADTPPSINFQMATGASGGQSDDGIKNVIVSPNQ